MTQATWTTSFQATRFSIIRGRRQRIAAPPFTDQVLPVTNPTLRLATKATRSAMSWAVPARRSGIRSMNFARRST